LGNFDLAVDEAKCSRILTHLLVNQNCTSNLNPRNQFREAIRQYYEKSPGGLKQYPKSLEDLLEDRRAPEVRRFLRKVFRDPITNDMKWGFIESPDGGVMGVFSLSDKEPLKQSGFDRINSEFEGKEKYSDWRFYYASTISPPLQKSNFSALR
jgi:hypothetical protein